MTETSAQDHSENKYRSKTATVTIRNPKNPEVSEQPHYWPDENEYEAIKTIRDDYAVDFKELMGQYFRALVQIHKTDKCWMMEELEEEVKDIEEIVKLTEYSENKSVRKTIEVSFRNGAHPENKTVTKQNVEHRWYEALKTIRDEIGRHYMYTVKSFCKAVVEDVENDNIRPLAEITYTLQK